VTSQDRTAKPRTGGRFLVFRGIFDVGMPRPLIVEAVDAAELARRSALLIADAIQLRPDAALLLATGNSPMATYDELAGMRERGTLDTSRVRVFQLDEYLGLGADDPRSLAGWMRRSFTEPLGIPDERVTWLDVDGDVEEGCARYARAVRAAGGYDLAVLGLGPNGHLGFNEPPASADAPTRAIDLAPESLISNAVYWGDDVPRRAATAGMDLIMEARSVLVIVSGAHKQAILSRMLEGEPSPDCPASWLRLRDGVIVAADRAALGS
jgi:glucosamine-6-phosphate deaminase